MIAKPQKILLVINSLEGGGAEKFVLTLGEVFAKLGYEVHLLCFNPKVEHIVPPMLIYHVYDFKKYKLYPKGKIRHFFFAKGVDSYIDKHIGRPLFILVNLYRAYEVFYYSRLINVAYVIHNQLSAKLKLHSLPANKLAYFKKVYTKYPTICVSHGVEDDFIRQFGAQQPICTIYNPIDREKIIEQASEPLPVALPKKPYLVHVGSFKAQKGHELLLQAYAKTSQLLPLILVGKGALQTQIKTLIAELGVQDNVMMVGFQPNPYPFIKNALGFVLSSHFEGFALVLVEALALGVPAISTDCPSGPNEILPQKNLVPVADIEALAARLETFMRTPSQYQVPFDEKFLPMNVANQYLEFMQRQVN